MTNLRTMIQEAVDLELQEIFGLFAKKPAVQGPGSTEQLPKDTAQTAPTEKFSLLTLKQLKTSRDIRNYVEKTLRELGRGQARAAYAFDSDKVVKVVLEDDKTYQNKNEIENSRCLGPKFAVQVLSFHPRYIWIVEERVNPIGKGEIVHKINQLTDLGATQLKFKSPADIQEFFTQLPTLLATDFSNFESQRGDFAAMGLLNHAERHVFMMRQQNEWYMEFGSKMTGCRFASWDFHAANWGIRPSTGDLVLLDLGFTRGEVSPEEQFFKEFIDMVLREEVNSNHGFSVEQLKAKTSLKDINSYLYFNAEFIGQGKQRSVYGIDSTKIVKVAIKEKDAVQNKNEILNAKCLGQRYSPVVYEFDSKNYFWVIQERLRPVASSDEFLGLLKKTTGYQFQTWEMARNFIYYSVSGEAMGDMAAQDYDKIFKPMYQTNEWFKGLIDGLKGCNVVSSDFHDENWGVRPSTGELVILDLGF